MITAKLKRRRWLITATLLLVAAVSARFAALQGIVRPVRIGGSSMAPALLGPHYELVCSDCRFTFPCDANAPAVPDRIVCPNCGHRYVPVSNDQLRPGQRVVIDRWPLWLGRLKRWQLVAFQDEQGHPVVKRLVGMPGERISIRDGDLMVDGRLEQKSLDQLRQQAVLVHDSRHRPRTTHGLAERWRPDDAESGWTVRDDDYLFAPLDTADEELNETSLELTDFDWLTYHNWRCYESPQDREEEYPVTDHYGYNQGLSRNVHQVHDLWLRCHVASVPGDGALALRGETSRGSFLWVINARAANSTLKVAGETVANGPFDRPSEHLVLDAAIVDGQVIVAANQRGLFRHQLPQPIESESSPVSPFRVGAYGGRWRITHLLVYRDLHFLDPYGQTGNWEMPERLGPAEYLLLGDNCPVSVDSRQWTAPGMAAGHLIGLVRPWRR